MKSVTGSSAKEFKSLARDFERELEKKKRLRYRNGLKKGKRERKPGGGRKGRLETAEDKLLFVLLYFKCYPTFDLLGLMFDLNRSNAWRNVRKLTQILERTLGEKMVLPEREIHTMNGLLEAFPEVQDLLVDGTERPTQRPKDKEKQKKNYSGRKKRHAKKNTVIADKDKRIRYLGPTVEGKKHDYGTFKDEFPPERSGKPPPKGMKFWMDTGYTGVKKDYPQLNVVMPKKRPRGKELTKGEKKANKSVSGFRVRVEHAIGGVKRFRI